MTTLILHFLVICVHSVIDLIFNCVEIYEKEAKN